MIVKKWYSQFNVITKNNKVIIEVLFFKNAEEKKEIKIFFKEGVKASVLVRFTNTLEDKLDLVCMVEDFINQVYGVCETFKEHIRETRSEK